MKTLLLMRHAKSSWNDPTQADHERPLNKRGKRTAPQMGELLVQHDLIPDVIVCSSAVRARQTIELMTAIRNVPITFENQIYLATVRLWIDVLKNFEDRDCVLSVGHNPGIESLVSQVAGKFTKMPTAAIAWFSVNESTEIPFLDRLTLETVWRPKELD